MEAEEKKLAEGPAARGGPAPQDGKAWEIFLIFLRLGCTSFGGPIAHIGYFKKEFVTVRKWWKETAFLDLVSLCQILPGPASSQTGIAIGYARGGWTGALAAWCGFTLPSAVILILFAWGMRRFGWDAGGALHGLHVVTVAVVAQALWSLAKPMRRDAPRLVLAAIGTLCAFLWPTGCGQLAVIAFGAFSGWLLLRRSGEPHLHAFPGAPSRTFGAVCLLAYGVLLVALPLTFGVSGFMPLQAFSGFFQAGALVFGGGHVVLPLLHAVAVDSHWVTNSQFLAGYGAAQAVPGPLFTFAAYLGSLAVTAWGGWPAGVLACIAIFLPGGLLVLGALPFWEAWRRNAGWQGLMSGINAAVVGLLLSAWFRPVIASGILSVRDLLLAVASAACLMIWKWPPWLVVAAAGILSASGLR